MKKATVFFVFLFALTTFAQTESSVQIRQKTFEKVWETVNEKYFDANFGGVDWKAVRERYAPQVAAVKTDAELYALLKKMLGELKVSHLEILTPGMVEKLKEVVTTTGLGLREIEDQIVITRLIENSSAVKAGLKTGFVVKAIDGEAVKNLNEAQQKLAGKPNTPLRLAYLDAKNETREVVLERVPLSNSDKGSLAGMNFYALFESKRLTDNIGYIRFTSFQPFLDPRIKTSIESMNDAPGIIIDLRGNSGGADSVGLNLANMFFDKETVLMITRTRKGDNLDYKAKPEKKPYLGKVVILVDELSGSESEQFAAGMQESGRAFVIGKTTAGEDLDADVMKLPTGAFFLYAAGEPRTPKGVIIEGRGVIPNLEVNLTRKDLLAGKDSQLEAAIEHIKNK